jgi:hypothetical protein
MSTRIKARICYWLASAERPPFTDAQSPTYYRLIRLRGEETIGYTTVKGYRRHVAMIRKALTEDNGRIITEYTFQPNGNRVIVYRPGWERGPHAAPHAVVIPPCEIEKDK